jgi:P4 family phage/plasmid primase-like protien
MSLTIEQIHKKASTIITGNGSFVGDERLSSITTVLTSFTLKKKDPSALLIKKLRSRANPIITDEELDIIWENVEKTIEAFKDLKRAEIQNVKNISNKEIPSYLMEVDDKDGMPTGQYIFDYMKYSDFLHKKLNVVNLSNNLFIYDENTNVYKYHINQIGTYTRNIVDEYGIIGKLSDIEHEVSVHIRNMGCVNVYPFMGKLGTIHVKNGCLDLKTGVLEKPSPEHMYDYRIETEYKSFTETQELDTFLKQYGTNEPIDILAKVIWQRAYRDTLKEITVIYGPRDAAKTTLGEFIQSVLDGNITANINVTRSLLHELLERFGFSNLEGKLMNFGDDLPDQFIKNSGRINKMVGSTNHHIEKKGKDGYDSFISTYYIFTCNNLPPLDDDDSVLWSKIRLVHQDKVFKGKRISNRDSLFTQTLKEQLLYRAVQKVLSWLETPYENEQNPDEVRRLWHEGTTDVDSFINSYTEFDIGNLISLDDIKKHYETWCAMYGRKIYMKYLNKKLKPFFKSTNMRNGYSLKLTPFPKTELTPGQSTL